MAVLQIAGEDRLRITGAVALKVRTGADDQLGAVQFQLEEGLDVLVDHDAAGIEVDRPRQVEDVLRPRLEALDIDAARPGLEIPETPVAQAQIGRASCRERVCPYG